MSEVDEERMKEALGKSTDAKNRLRLLGKASASRNAKMGNLPDGGG